MFITELFESTNTIKNLVVIIPGGYHPFHPGHLSLYTAARRKWPSAEIYLASTDNKKERPFPFEMKKQLAQLAGIPAEKFVQVKIPFRANEIVDRYDPNTTAVIFVRSEKDADESSKLTGTKKDGSPSYIQPYTANLQPAAKHAYIDFLPTIQFKAGKSGITSASQIREMWPSMSAEDKAGLLTDLYPILQKNPALVTKLSAQLDQILSSSVTEQAGVGQIAKRSQARDPRYSMSLTKDVRPDTLKKQLRAFHLESDDASDIDEMALKSYTTVGDFDKPGPFQNIDKKIVQHPVTRIKTANLFSRSPYDFRLFFAQIKGTQKYRERGEQSPEILRKWFGDAAEQFIKGSDDAITVIFVGNFGAEKVPMTPWIMAHRIGHAIQASQFKTRTTGAWKRAENHFFKTINEILGDYYAKPVDYTYNMRSNKTDFAYLSRAEYNALFNKIGTQRSSRSGQINRPYEFLYEIFTQYIATGHVRLNPLPNLVGYGKKVFGRPTQYLRSDMDAVEASQITETLARDMEHHFNEVLSEAVGKIFVM